MTQTDIGPGRFFIGAKQPMRVLVTNDGTDIGTPTNMTGWGLVLVIKRNVSDSVALVTLTNGAPDNSISLTSVNGTNDCAIIDWERGDTLTVLEHMKEYQWALWRTDDPNDYPVAYGKLVPTLVASQ